jgi:hypothetical protein
VNDELNERRRSNDADGSAPPARSSRPGDHLDAETLAGYIGRADDLSREERVGIEAHLSGCAFCQQTLAELRSIVAAMSELAEIEPSRSFALTPAMAGKRDHLRPVPAVARDVREPVELRQTSAWQERQMRAVRWATVAAAILFVFVLTADMATSRLGGPRSVDESAPVSALSSDPAGMMQPAAAEPTEAAAAADTEAAADSEAMRAAGEESPEDAPAAAASAQDDPDQARLEATEAEKEEAFDLEVGSAVEAVEMAADEDRRSMSTPGHYWRLAQVGLAMLIVWLLAAMIVLPRWHAGRRR